MSEKSTKVVLRKVRGSYVYADKPNKNGKYGIKVLIPKKDKVQLAAIRKAIKLAAEKKFGSDVKLARLKTPLRDPEEEEFDGKEYKGMMFFNANSSTKRPGIAIVRNGRPEPADEDDIEEYCYSGAYFTVSVTFYGFEPKPGEGGKPGVAAGFNNLLIGKHGERLDGTIAASDDFADYADDFDADDDEDFDDDL